MIVHQTAFAVKSQGAQPYPQGPQGTERSWESVSQGIFRAQGDETGIAVYVGHVDGLSRSLDQQFFTGRVLNADHALGGIGDNPHNSLSGLGQAEILWYNMVGSQPSTHTEGGPQNA